MSEEEDSFLNVKRSLKKRMVKHSTPVDSVLLRSMPSLTDLTNQSIRDQDATKRLYGSPVPKLTLSKSLAQVSSVRVEAYFPQAMSPKRLSVVFDSEESSEEISQSSQAFFSRRRLSTVLASDESADPSSKTALNVEREAPAEAAEEVAPAPSSVLSWLVTGIPGIKDPPIAKTKKKRIDKALVKKKQREWELRQFKNIEEAIEHELTVEEA
ncbi:coiled-coil domain-containing protein 201 [Eudromia elegans]